MMAAPVRPGPPPARLAMPPPHSKCGPDPTPIRLRRPASPDVRKPRIPRPLDDPAHPRPVPARRPPHARRGGRARRRRGRRRVKLVRKWSTSDEIDGLNRRRRRSEGYLYRHSRTVVRFAGRSRPRRPSVDPRHGVRRSARRRRSPARVPRAGSWRRIRRAGPAHLGRADRAGPDRRAVRR